MALQYINSIPIFPLQLADYVDSGASYRSYRTASTAATGFVYNTMYNKRIVDAESPCGANCSFTQTFHGPAYKCDDVDFLKDNDTANPFCLQPSSRGYGICGGVFDASTINTFTTTWYSARNSTSTSCQIKDGCIPVTDPWREGKIWIAYKYFLPQYRNLANANGVNSTPVPDEAWERYMFSCQSYNATYKLRRSYNNFQHTVTGDLTYGRDYPYHDIAMHC
jgi:hypothetical protein